MAGLRTELSRWRGRRVVLLGAGNALEGDDGFGVRLAWALAAREDARGAGGEPPLRAIDAGLAPERWVGEAVRAGAEVLVLADAVDFGGAPGEVLLASPAELAARPVAASTHRVPLPVLAQYAEGLGASAFVLGVQPASLRPGEALSPPVAAALDALVEILCGARDVPAADLGGIP
jgi:hydrogenase maturation protease